MPSPVISATIEQEKDLSDAVFFQKKLRQEVKQALEMASKTPQTSLIKKACLITASWLLCYIFFLYAANLNHLMLILLASVLIGLATAIVGFTVFHDASHACFSSNPKINQLISTLTSSPFGVSSLIWYEKHVKSHHVYTNTVGKDDDIETGGLFVFHRYSKKHKAHRFQHYYALPLYSLLMFKWIYYDDFKAFFSNQFGFNRQKKRLALYNIIISKAIHGLLFFIIPSYFFLSFSYLIFAYIIANMILGISLSIVFQLAHINTKAAFYESHHTTLANRVVNQLASTADFGPNNKMLSYLLGGLNMQVIHHLFPYIPHVNYPTIQPIIKSFCKKYDLIYHEYPSLFSALSDHFSYLKNITRHSA